MLYRNPLTSENDKMQNRVIKLHGPSSQILSSIVFSLITFFRSCQIAMILIFSSHTGHKSCGLWKRHCQQQFPCLDCRFSCSPNLAAPGERLSLYTVPIHSKEWKEQSKEGKAQANPWWNLPCLENSAGQKALASPTDAPQAQQPKAETERFQDFLQKTGTYRRGKELEMNFFLITGAKTDKWH